MADKTIRQCRLCRKSIVKKNGLLVGQEMRECRACPPQPVVLPTPQGISINYAFPPVADAPEFYCFQFEPLQKE